MIKVGGSTNLLGDKVKDIDSVDKSSRSTSTLDRRSVALSHKGAVVDILRVEKLTTAIPNLLRIERVFDFLLHYLEYHSFTNLLIVILNRFSMPPK